MSAAVAASLASGGVESVGFLNDIVAQLWDHINVAGSKMIKDIVEPLFKELLPGPLKSLHFTRINLGKTPIKFDNIDVHSRTENSIRLNVDISWNGDSDIDLKASIIGSLGVEKVKIKGRLSVLLCPLVDHLPLITAMQAAFINPPEMSLDFTGVADIADLSIIDDTIRKVILDIIASILVLPNRLLIKIDPANDYFKTYQPQLGFIRVTVLNGKGFVTPKGFFKDIPDVYCNVRLGALPVWTTTTQNNTLSPHWNESNDFLLSDHDQELTFDVLDDDLTGDDKLGSGKITVGKLLLAGKHADIPLVAKGKNTGAKIAIKCEIYEFVPDLASFTDPNHLAKDRMCGMITIIVANARKVPGDRLEIMPHVKVRYGSKDFDTPMLTDMPGIDTNNPDFDCPFRIPLNVETAKAKDKFSFTLMERQSELATLEVAYDDVVAAPGHCLNMVHKKLDNGSSISIGITVAGIKLTA